LERISSLESDVGVYVHVHVGLPVLGLGFVNSKLLYKTVNIVCFAHKDDIIGGFVSWNDNVFAVEVCYGINNIFVIEYRSNFRTHRSA